MIVPGGGFLFPSSGIPGVCSGEGTALDEIDTCIRVQINTIPVIFFEADVQSFEIRITA